MCLIKEASFIQLVLNRKVLLYYTDKVVSKEESFVPSVKSWFTVHTNLKYVLFTRSTYSSSYSAGNGLYYTKMGT